MDNNELFADEQLDEHSDELSSYEQRNLTKNKTRKRKWREIESIKEQRRLRRELAQYEQYSY